VTIRLTMWNEGRHEKNDPPVAKIYPDGMDGALAAGFNDRDFSIERRTIDDPEQGLTQELLDRTDVLTWWGHVAHDEVKDEYIDRVQQRVLAGMGLVVLHSGHHSKMFRRMVGTNANLSWRELPEGDLERVWTILPSHPIADGVPPFFEIPASEMYGEPFDIPAPDEIVFLSWYKGGEVFRSGLTFYRGLGRIFYFSPGHETFPIYHQSMVQHVIGNGIEWAMQPHKPSRKLDNWHRKEPIHR
jgi:trehalose utilization protein